MKKCAATTIDGANAPFPPELEITMKTPIGARIDYKSYMFIDHHCTTFSDYRDGAKPQLEPQDDIEFQQWLEYVKGVPAVITRLYEPVLVGHRITWDGCDGVAAVDMRFDAPGYRWCEEYSADFQQRMEYVNGRSAVITEIWE